MTAIAQADGDPGELDPQGAYLRWMERSLHRELDAVLAQILTPIFQPRRAGLESLRRQLEARHTPTPEAGR